VGVNDDGSALQECDGIGRRLHAAGDAALDGEVEPELVVEAAQGSEGNAAPAPCDRPVHVAEEDVPDIVSFKHLCKGVRILEHDLVDRAQVHGQRMVMHEQVAWTTRCLFKPRLQPCLSLCAIGACVPGRLLGVEEQEAPGVGVDERLNETICVGWLFGKHLEKLVTGVVIADNQADGHRQRF